MPSTFLKANSCEIVVLFLATNPSPCLQVPQSNFLSNNNCALIVKFSSNCCRDFSAVLSCERLI
jgi:hypothetical protein